jgi:diguanylate cyclase (GGDEF)-like protein
MISLRDVVRRAPAAGAARPAAVLVAFAALGLALFQVHAATQDTAHADRVLLHANELERKVIDLETGLRGYAITRDHVFLQPMLDAQRGIPDELDELEALVAGEPAQRRRAQAITNAVWTYARYWLRPALRLHESDSALAAQMWASVGRERMQMIRQRFAAFERAERAERDDAAGRVSTWWGLAVTTVLASLLGFAAMWAFTLRRRRDGAAADVETLAARLEAIDARNDALLDEIASVRRTDKLTGMPDREAFLERLDTECTASRRHCGDFSVLLLDIDGLAAINDEHGYAAGNAVLLRIVALLNQQLRSGDVIARVGGDEFGILLPRTPARGAQVVIAGLTGAISSDPVTAGGVEIPVTVSIGAASAAHDAEPGTMLHAAEADLTARKAPGAGLERQAA